MISSVSKFTITRKLNAKNGKVVQHPTTVNQQCKCILHKVRSICCLLINFPSIIYFGDKVFAIHPV